MSRNDQRVKVPVSDDLRESLQEALAFERGEEVDLHVTKLPRDAKTRPGSTDPPTQP